MFVKGSLTVLFGACRCTKFDRTYLANLDDAQEDMAEHKWYKNASGTAQQLCKLIVKSVNTAKLPTQPSTTVDLRLQMANADDDCTVTLPKDHRFAKRASLVLTLSGRHLTQYGGKVPGTCPSAFLTRPQVGLSCSRSRLLRTCQSACCSQRHGVCDRWRGAKCLVLHVCMHPCYRIYHLLSPCPC